MNFMELPEAELYVPVDSNTILPPITEDHISEFLHRFNKKGDVGKELYNGKFLSEASVAYVGIDVYLRGMCRDVKRQCTIHVKIGEEGEVLETSCDCCKQHRNAAYCNHVIGLLYAAEEVATEGTIKLLRLGGLPEKNVNNSHSNRKLPEKNLDNSHRNRNLTEKSVDNSHKDRRVSEKRLDNSDKDRILPEKCLNDSPSDKNPEKSLDNSHSDRTLQEKSLNSSHSDRILLENNPDNPHYPVTRTVPEEDGIIFNPIPRRYRKLPHYNEWIQNICRTFGTSTMPINQLFAPEEMDSLKWDHSYGKSGSS